MGPCWNEESMFFVIKAIFATSMNAEKSLLKPENGLVSLACEYKSLITRSRRQSETEPDSSA